MINTAVKTLSVFNRDDDPSLHQRSNSSPTINATAGKIGKM